MWITNCFPNPTNIVEFFAQDSIINITANEIIDIDIGFHAGGQGIDWFYRLNGIEYGGFPPGLSLCYYWLNTQRTWVVRLRGTITSPGTYELYNANVHPYFLCTLVVASPPMPRVTNSPPQGVVGQPYTHTITYDSSTTLPVVNPVFTITGLSSELTAEANTISGTPITISDYYITIHITCDGNPTGTDTVQLVSIKEPVPVITALTNSTGTAPNTFKITVLVGQPVTSTIVATNNPTTFNLSSSPSLPSFVHFSATSPVFDISPTNAVPCNYQFAITLDVANTNAVHGTGTVLVTVINTGNPVVSVDIPPIPTSAYVGEYMNFGVKADACPSTLVADSDIPTGLSIGTLSSSDYVRAKVSGTPLEDPGNHGFSITATRIASGSVPYGQGVGGFVVPLYYKAPVVTWPTTIYEWIIGLGGFSSPVITAVNNPTTIIPQTFNFTSTGLPTGLSINAADGIISGTPTVAFSGAAIVNCDNAGLFPGFADPANSGITLGTVNFYIATALELTPVVTSETNPWDTNYPLDGGTGSETGQDRYATGIRDTYMEYQIEATHYPTSFASSALPTGLSLNATTGLISGTPTVFGMFNVDVTATNQFTLTSAIVTVWLLISYPAPAITSPLATFGIKDEVFDPPADMGGQPPPPAGYHITATIEDADTISSYEADISNINPTIPTLTLDTITGVISGTPTVEANIYEIILKVHNIGAHIIAPSNPGNPFVTDYTVPAQEPTDANEGLKTLSFSVYGLVPTITSVSPLIVYPSGTPITITGTNFVVGAQVLVGSITNGFVSAVVDTSAVTSTNINATTGSMNMSDDGYDVVVINPDGQAAVLSKAVFVLPIGSSLLPTARYTSLYTSENPIYNVLSTEGKSLRKQRIFGLGTNVEVLFYSGIDGNKILNVQRKQLGTTSTRHAAGDLVFKGVASISLSPLMYKTNTGEKLAHIACVLRSNGRIDMNVMRVQDLQIVEATDLAYAMYQASLIRSLTELPLSLIGSSDCTET